VTKVAGKFGNLPHTASSPTKIAQSKYFPTVFSSPLTYIGSRRRRVFAVDFVPQTPQYLDE
jgi:hypothetical protein